MTKKLKQFIKLVESMSGRIQDLIKNKDGHINY